MSNVIALDEWRAARARARAEFAVPWEPYDGGVCAIILLEGLDDAAQALDKAAGVIASMPYGAARAQAEHELAGLRFRLGIA